MEFNFLGTNSRLLPRDPPCVRSSSSSSQMERDCLGLILFWLTSVQQCFRFQNLRGDWERRTFHWESWKIERNFIFQLSQPTSMEFRKVWEMKNSWEVHQVFVCVVVVVFVPAESRNKEEKLEEVDRSCPPRCQWDPRVRWCPCGFSLFFLSEEHQERKLQKTKNCSPRSLDSLGSGWSGWLAGWQKGRLENWCLQKSLSDD